MHTSAWDLLDENFECRRLAVWNEGPLIAGQRDEKGRFHLLHTGLDSAQRVASNRNLVSGEDQSKVLLLAFAFEFSESELVER